MLLYLTGVDRYKPGLEQIWVWRAHWCQDSAQEYLETRRAHVQQVKQPEFIKYEK